MNLNRRVLGVGLGLFLLWTLVVRLAFFSPLLVVEVEMASTTAGTAQLFAADGSGFREGLSARAALLPGAGFVTHRFELELDGGVEALRLDPTDAPGRIALRAVEVRFAGAAERFTGADLAGWTPHQLVSHGLRDGALELEAQGRDPRLVVPWRHAAPSPWSRPSTPREMLVALFILPLLVLLVLPADARFRHLLALATPVGLYLVLNGDVLGSWWTHDDPCLLVATLRHGAAAHFFVPEVWRALSGSVLMPWTTLSLGLDATLFGLAPRGFYLHQLVAGAVMLAAVYFFGRRFLGVFGASLAASLVAVSTPAHALARLLMNRHYVEGTVLVLLALGLYLRSLRGGGSAAAWGGAVLYLLAATAKEVFVPLVAILPLLPVGGFRERLRHAVPFAAAAALYAGWRLYMLGPSNSFSGYVERGTEPGAGAALPALGLEPWQALAAGLAVLGALVIVARRSPRQLVLGLVVLAVLALPLFSIPSMLAPRHFLLPLVAAAFLAASVLEPARRGVVGVVAVALLAADLHALTHSTLWRHHDTTAALYRTEGAFVLEREGEGLLLTRTEDSRFLTCVAELRREVLELPAGPGFCGDPCWCTGAFPGLPLWQAAESGVAAVTPPPGDTCAVTRPLTVEMHYDAQKGRLAWRFGPWADGDYRLLLVSSETPPGVSIPVPIVASGEAPFTLAEPLRFVVRYRSPEGWQTYSDVLVLDPRAGSLTRTTT